MGSRCKLAGDCNDIAVDISTQYEVTKFKREMQLNLLPYSIEILIEMQQSFRVRSRT